MYAKPTHSSFGNLLRHWHQIRRTSQLDLASSAATSPRHVSFVETGWSRPGRDLILRFVAALEIPLRDQNALLASASFAKPFADHSADDFLQHPLRHTIEAILDRHAPYPAAAFSGDGQVLLTNAPFDILAPSIASRTPEENTEGFFHPEGGRKIFANWDEMAWAWLAKTRHKIALENNPKDINLLNIARSHLPKEPLAPSFDQADVISPIWIIDGQHIHTFTTVTRFDAPLEVTLSELKIELVYPADDAAEAFFADLGK